MSIPRTYYTGLQYYNKKGISLTLSMANGYGHTGDKGACSLIMHVLCCFNRFSGRWGGRASDRLDLRKQVQGGSREFA